MSAPCCVQATTPSAVEVVRCNGAVTTTMLRRPNRCWATVTERSAAPAGDDGTEEGRGGGDAIALGIVMDLARNSVAQSRHTSDLGRPRIVAVDHQRHAPCQGLARGRLVEPCAALKA